MSTRIKQALFSLLLAVLLVPATLLALPATQTDKAPQMDAHPHHHHGMTETHDAKMQDCQAMMAERQQMHEKMQAMDAKLGDMVDQMQDASGEDKIEALAAVVTELVTQRRQMHEKMWAHHAHMMQHMMTHMQAMQSGTREGMEDCPMMQAMAQGDEPLEDPDESGDSHEEHHP